MCARGFFTEYKSFHKLAMNVIIVLVTNGSKMDKYLNENIRDFFIFIE